MNTIGSDTSAAISSIKIPVLRRTINSFYGGMQFYRKMEPTNIGYRKIYYRREYRKMKPTNNGHRKYIIKESLVSRAADSGHRNQFIRGFVP
jgi:hypothetical protein